MKKKSLFRRKEAQESVHQEKQTGETHRSFDSVEELLRYDAARVRFPKSLPERLGRSVSLEPGKRPWWRRLLDRGK